MASKIELAKARMRERLARLRGDPAVRRRLAEAAGAFVGARVAADGGSVELDAASLEDPFVRGVVIGAAARCVADESSSDGDTDGD